MQKAVSIVINGAAIVMIAFAIVITLVNLGIVSQQGEYTSFAE